MLFADELQQPGKHIASGAGFVSNFVFWRESGYFDVSAEGKPLLHLWSLGIKEQFYVVWLLLVAVVLRFRINGAATCAAIAVASVVLNVANVGDNPIAAFYSPLNRCWELLIGALLAFPSIAGRLDRLQENCRSFLSVSGHLCLLAGLVTISPSRAFPGFLALLPTVGAACVIAAGPRACLNRRLLSMPLLVASD